jgi:hypothetical protein
MSETGSILLNRVGARTGFAFLCLIVLVLDALSHRAQYQLGL